MAVIPNSNLTGLPVVTVEDLKNADPSRLNRILRLLATQVHGVQTGAASSSTNITNITNESSSSSSSSSSSGTATTVTLQGTHSVRLADHLPASEPAGSYFYETDRTVTYLNFLSPSTVQVWQWVSGTMRGLFAARPADLGQYDAGFLFYATNRNLLFEWDGTVWSEYIVIEPVVQDTYANWTAVNYPPANYAPGTLFVVTDRNWIYSVQVITAVHTWVLVYGEYGAVTASRPTTGFDSVALGTHDTGMLFVDTTLKFLQRWDGSSWVQTPDIPAPFVVLASNASKQIIAATLASGKIWVGNGLNAPVAQTITGAIAIDNAGVSTTAASGGVVTPGSYTNANITVTADGIVTAAANGSSGAATTGTWTPDLTFGGSNTGITYSTQFGSYWTFSNLVIATFDILLTSKGALTGIAEIGGLPFSVAAAELISGSVIYGLNMLALTGTPTILSQLGTTKIATYNWGATGAANLTDVNFTNTTRLIGCVIYQT